MITVRYGYGCRLAIRLVTPFGEEADIRRARRVTVMCRNPRGVVRTVPWVRYDETANTVHVKFPPVALATLGEYAIVVDVLDGPLMLATPLTAAVEVVRDGNAGDAEVSTEMTLSIVDFPPSVSVTGASPKVSRNGTWLVYDDTLKAFVDTGIEVGFASIVTRYDEKYAEILQPAVEAADRANEAAAKAEEAAAKDETAAQEAQEAADRAEKAADEAREIVDSLAEITASEVEEIWDSTDV